MYYSGMRYATVPDQISSINAAAILYLYIINGSHRRNYATSNIIVVILYDAENRRTKQ